MLGAVALAGGVGAYAIRWLHIGWHQTATMHCADMTLEARAAWLVFLAVAALGGVAAASLETRRVRAGGEQGRFGTLAVTGPSAGAVILAATSWLPGSCQ